MRFLPAAHANLLALSWASHSPSESRTTGSAPYWELPDSSLWEEGEDHLFFRHLGGALSPWPHVTRATDRPPDNTNNKLAF